MKKILSIILTFGLIMAGCTTEKEMPEALGLSSRSVTLAAKGETKTVQVYTNAESWTAEVSPVSDWCKVSTSANLISVTAETANESLEARTATVIVSTKGGETLTIPVTQSGIAEVFQASTDLLIIGAEDLETKTVKIESNIGDWTFEVADATHFEVAKTAESDGLTVKPKATNSSGAKYETTITVSLATGTERDDQVKPLEITIRQHSISE